MNNFSSSSNHHLPPSPASHKPYHHHYYHNNNRLSYSNNHHFVSSFQPVSNPHNRCRFPPPLSTTVSFAGSNVFRRPNFIIQLLQDYSPSPSEPNNIQSMIFYRDPSPESFHIFTTGKIAASLTFQEWNQTLYSVLYLWRSHLDGSHHYTSKL
ncbi:hypothetical protein like AT4G01020 [Hibiscus trionum]|uniref:Uncharacterized protein n=1 Tax=Hibiscus trionum TaxID=183268 RepID=A0A9W7JD38_HIBTR|nr:hypothetical protein like AT4G01020 [Hibiscus trionum]